MYMQNNGHLAAVTIAGLVWDIITDTAQFFYKFPTEDDFLADPQRDAYFQSDCAPKPTISQHPFGFK